ncbi:hypothetical protein, partial [Salinivibrio sp. EAGSL]|uniref:hypothetical protein n=1 Tax=Salinivibrio sp. EAGSL TaxID=2738468 RepID=UPI001C3788A1
MLGAYSGIFKEVYKPQCIHCDRQAGRQVKKASCEQYLNNMIGFVLSDNYGGRSSDNYLGRL